MKQINIIRGCGLIKMSCGFTYKLHHIFQREESHIFNDMRGYL